jgi:hypothetical protein
MMENTEIKPQLFLMCPKKPVKGKNTRRKHIRSVHITLGAGVAQTVYLTTD